MPFWSRKDKKEVQSPEPVEAAIVAKEEARDLVYEGMFGERSHVYNEKPGKSPHVDVFTYPPQNGRDFFTLVTGGMSDRAMTLPEDMEGIPRRVELILYCSEPKDEYLEGLRELARFVHDQDTWIGFGLTIPNGDPPRLIWGSKHLNTLLLMPTIVRPDNNLLKSLQIGGDAVQFVWLVPISKGEADLHAEEGFGALLDVFEKQRHPVVFDPNRGSYL